MDHKEEKISVLQFLIDLNNELEQGIPCNERNKIPGTEQFTKPSNSAIRRMLENKSVTINGVKAEPGDIVILPVEELVFFKGSKKQVTL